MKKTTDTTVTIPGLIQNNNTGKQEFEKIRCTIRRGRDHTVISIHVGVMQFTFQADTFLKKLRGETNDPS